MSVCYCTGECWKHGGCPNQPRQAPWPVPVGNMMPVTQQGWQCPSCQRVYSPSTGMCWYCGNHGAATSTFKTE